MPIDFSQDETRREMAHAIAAIAESLGQPEPLWINGEAVRAKDMPLESVNPADPSEIVARFPEATAEQLQAVEDAAIAGGAAWRAIDAEERAARLQRVARSLEPRRLELAAWLCFEAGMPWRTADREIDLALGFLTGEEMPAAPRQDVATVELHAPHALAACAHLVARELRAGNPVIVRPDRSVPLVIARLVEAFHWEAALPPGVVNFVPTRAHREPEVARLVYGLEPAAIDDEVRLALSDSGQRHTRVFLVDPADYDATTQRIRGALANLRVGAGIDYDTDLGPMRDAALHARALAVPGAADGEFPNDSGYWVQPTLVEGAMPDLPLGPFVQVVAVPRAEWAENRGN